MAESLLTLAQAADRSRSRRRHPTPSKDRRAHVLKGSVEPDLDTNNR